MECPEKIAEISLPEMICIDFPYPQGPPGESTDGLRNSRNSLTPTEISGTRAQ